MLMEYGVIAGINSLPIIPLPSNKLNQENSQDYLFSLNDDTTKSNNVHTEEDIQMMLEPILRFLNAMCASSPCYEVLKQCCQFLTHNYHIISYFLHFKSSSIKGLSMIHSIINLICLIVPATCSVQQQQQQQQNNANQSLLASVWETEMGPKGDIYTTELCRLMRIFGSKPIQNWNYVSVSSRTETQRTERDAKLSWWNIIKPTSPYEEKLHETLSDPPECLKNEFFKSSGRLNTNQWSLFDNIKFFLGLNTLERLSSFFRIRCSLCIRTSQNGIRLQSKNNNMNNNMNNNSNTFNNNYNYNDSISNEIGLLAFNITDISYTFQSVASFYLKIFNSLDENYNGGGNNNNNNLNSSSNINNSTHSKWLTESNILSSPFTPSVNVNMNSNNKNDNNYFLNQQIFNNSLNLSQTNEIKKLILYSTESLLCVLYDLLLLYSSEEENERNRGINVNNNGNNLSSDWKGNHLSDIIQCLNITESFQTHSFIRQLSRYIHQMISYDQLQLQQITSNNFNQNYNKKLNSNLFKR